MENFILFSMAYFLVKHFVCDFPISIQTPWMFQNKGTYGHPGGIVHSLIHSFATLPFSLWVLLVVTDFAPAFTVTKVLLIFVGEFLIHYHMDWFKMWWCAERGYKPDTHSEFWWWLGFDQLVHGLTYVAIVAVYI